MKKIRVLINSIIIFIAAIVLLSFGLKAEEARAAGGKNDEWADEPALNTTAGEKEEALTDTEKQAKSQAIKDMSDTAERARQMQRRSRPPAIRI